MRTSALNVKFHSPFTFSCELTIPPRTSVRDVKTMVIQKACQSDPITYTPATIAQVEFRRGRDNREMFPDTSFFLEDFNIWEGDHVNLRFVPNDVGATPPHLTRVRVTAPEKGDADEFAALEKELNM